MYAIEYCGSGVHQFKSLFTNPRYGQSGHVNSRSNMFVPYVYMFTCICIGFFPVLPIKDVVLPVIQFNEQSAFFSCSAEYRIKMIS